MTTLVVPQRVADRLARTCDVPFALFEPAPDVADGEVVTLRTPTTALGMAVVDRGASCLRLMSDAREAARPDRDWAESRLRDAYAMRAAWNLAGDARAFRLLNGAGDRTPGLVADVYADWMVVSSLSPAMQQYAQVVAETWVSSGMGRGAVVKLRGRGRASEGPAVVDQVGEPPPHSLVVREGTWQFEVHLTTGVNVGLFTDMRDERLRLRAVAAGRRVLNLFAYTGALSVAVASGGAAEVTSVDLSEGALAWARDHFVLNELDPARHRTVAQDASGFVVDAAARGDCYDLVIVDPPSYSAARGAPFAIDRDYPTLLAAAAGLVTPGGYLWAASNTRGFSLTGAVQQAVTKGGRRAAVVGVGGLPADYPTELADVDARYLQACLARLV